MMYLLDTCIFRKLLDHFPRKGKQFEAIWLLIDKGIESKQLRSVDECLCEMQKHYSEESANAKWLDERKSLFEYPNNEESLIIKDIFLFSKMRENIHLKNLLENRPSADVYLVAKGKRLQATVVTAEEYKPNSAQLPNMCEQFNVRCIGFDDFMDEYLNGAI